MQNQARAARAARRDERDQNEREAPQGQGDAEPLRPEHDNQDGDQAQGQQNKDYAEGQLVDLSALEEELKRLGREALADPDDEGKVEALRKRCAV